MKRLTTLLAPTDLGAAGTKTVDIDTTGVISRMIIRFRLTVVTVSVMTKMVTDTISKIEIVDGGTVLFSASGGDAFALPYWEGHALPYQNISLTVGGFFECAILVNFGRWLYDPMLAFTPERFSNPQLKITWDEDACNASVVVNEFSVHAYEDDSPPGGGPSGFLMTKEVKSYAMTASAHEYTELPTDYPVRMLLVRGYSEDHAPVTLLSRLKLDVDNGRVVLVDHDIDDLFEILSSYPVIQVPVVLDNAVTAKTLFMPVSEDPQISVEYDATAFVTAQSKFAVPTYTGPKCALSASVDIKGQTAKIAGRLPACTLAIPFGDLKEPDSWLDIVGSRSLRADITATSDADSGDTTALVVQQYVRY